MQKHLHNTKEGMRLEEEKDPMVDHLINQVKDQMDHKEDPALMVVEDNFMFLS